MDMKYGLPGQCVTVHDGAISGFGYAFVGGDFFCRQVHFTYQFSIVGLHIVESGYVFFGDYQDMSWGLWVEITESQNIVVLIHNIPGDIARYNFAKDTVAHFWIL